MATTGTLFSLAPQPLPKGDLVDSVFVTIWFFAVACFALILSWLLRIPYAGSVLNSLFERSRPALDVFRSICLATGILAFWYFFVMIDRWFHYSQRVSVSYGYIIFLTLVEILRVFSAVIFAWGNYKIVWVEIEPRYSLGRQGQLWLAAKVALFLVSLVSIFYAVLHLTLAVAWLCFWSLNSIADIATRRTSFEVATAAFLAAFTALTFCILVHAIFFQSRKVDGKRNDAWKNRWLLVVATFLLLARSFVEFISLLIILGPTASRGSMTFARDVSYGLLSCLYLLFISVYASGASSPNDMGKADTQDVRANLRRYIDEKLRIETDDARKEARPFIDIIVEVEEAFNNDTDNLKARLCGASTLSTEANGATIESCFRQLRRDFGDRGLEQHEVKHHMTSPRHSTTSFFSTLAGGGGHKIFGAVSDPNIRGTSKKRSNRSLLDTFRSPGTSGRRSAPPTMPGAQSRPGPNFDHDPLETTDTISEWTRTENLSRRGSAAGLPSFPSAPVRNSRLTTHIEELPAATHGYDRGGAVRDHRIFTDTAVYGPSQQRQQWESSEPERSSTQAQDMGYGQSPGPESAYPHAAYPDGASARVRRQRRPQRDFQPPSRAFEMEPYRAYQPQATVAPSSFGPENSYAVRAHSTRWQATGAGTGEPGTPYMQQAMPAMVEAAGSRQYTPDPEQVSYAQELFVPNVQAAQSNDDPGSRPPPPAPATPPSAGEQGVSETLPPGTRQAGPTMRFQMVGGRGRRAAAAQASSSTQAES